MINSKYSLIALTHVVSPRINECEVTHRQRESIDYDRAVEQHEAYCQLLKECGIRVIELSVNRDYPDSTFIEDTAMVFDEIAVMASIGVESRQGEVESIESEIAKYRVVVSIQPPATLDGGDVLRMNTSIFVGHSQRTNTAGIHSLKTILDPFGYRIVPVQLRDCLHLKSACTAVGDDTLLVNPRWLDLEPFSGYRILHVPENEPWAANVLRIHHVLCLHAGFVQTIQMLQNENFTIKAVDISELLKAEAGMTCSSIVFNVSAK